MPFRTQPLSQIVHGNNAMEMPSERPLEAVFVISPGGEIELGTLGQKRCHEADVTLSCCHVAHDK